VALTATVEQGGGSIIGPAAVTTDPHGYASVGWRLGNGGAQRLTVRLTDSDGSERQRLTYAAAIGGCDITIGPGGQFEHLDSELVRELLEASNGNLCLCFLPGAHEIDELKVEGDKGRLSLHGCAQTAALGVRGAIQLSGFASVELRDLLIAMTDSGMTLSSLSSTGEVRLSGISLARSTSQGSDPLLRVSGAKRLDVTGCEIGLAVPASAVFENITGECHISSSRFAGTVSFYGVPGGDRSEALIRQLGGSKSPGPKPPDSEPPISKPLQLKALGGLHFVGNSVQVLTIGEDVAGQLVEKQSADSIFQTAVLQGNTFGAQSNMFVSALLNVVGNSFVPEPIDRSAPFGVMVASRAAAVGNVAALFSDNVALHFLTTAPPAGGFSEAANQVFTQNHVSTPPSTP
jgi:hypothetical protein